MIDSASKAVLILILILSLIQDYGLRVCRERRHTIGARALWRMIGLERRPKALQQLSGLVEIAMRYIGKDMN